MVLNKAHTLLLVAAGLLVLGTQTTRACTEEGCLGSDEPLRPLVTFTLGPDYMQKRQSQTIALLPPFQNSYTNTNTKPTMEFADAGIFVGVESALNDRLRAQLGVSGYADSQLKIQGRVWQFGLPQFETLAYSYKVQHKRAMLEGKFLTSFRGYRMLHPYVSWGLGAAFNKASNYQETPLILGAIPTLPFSNNTQTSLAWGLGLGVDYSINRHVRFGAGYQFADLGSVSLGPTLAATTRQTLSFAHLYSNQLRFQLMFVM